MGRKNTKQKISERPAPTTDSMSTLPLLLSESVTSTLLGVSMSYLRKSRSEGKILNRTQAPPFVRVGGRVYYRRNDVTKWVENLTAQQVVGG